MSHGKFGPPPQGEDNKFELEFFEWKVQSYTSRHDYGFQAKIPVLFSAEAARLLIESQRTGQKIKATFELVESEPGDLQG